MPYLYCKPATKKALLKIPTTDEPQMLFSSESRLGKNSIGHLLQDLARDAGISEWKKKRNHCLRGFSLTALANDLRNNPNKAARCARHKSIQSQKSYLKTNKTSETNRSAALGQGISPMRKKESSPQQLPPKPAPLQPTFAVGVPQVHRFVSTSHVHMQPTLPVPPQPMHPLIASLAPNFVLSPVPIGAPTLPFHVVQPPTSAPSTKSHD